MSHLNRANPARVLIVDDHPAVREALCMRIGQSEDLKVCGEASDIPSALNQIATCEPDIAIVDIALRNGDGIDLIKRIRARGLNMCILVWSMFGEDLYAERALRAGAQGYLTKDEATESIVDAIRLVLDGKVQLKTELAQRLMQQSTPGNPNAGRPDVQILSDREIEVFRLIGLGRTTQEIAEHLHLSPKTIETYRDRIRQKLNLRNGAELTRRAIAWLTLDAVDQRQPLATEPGSP